MLAFRIFALLWCTCFAIWEAYCLAADIGNFTLHLFCLGLQLSVGGMFLYQLLMD